MSESIRQQCKALVEKVLNHDEKAFAEFYKQYDRIVWQHALKWIVSIGPVSMGMYETEDIHSELWEHIWKNLRKYDSERANLVSWFYLVCSSRAGMMYRNLNASDCSPTIENTYLHDVMYDLDGGELELVSMIIDPKEAFDDIVLDEIRLYDYIYILKQFIESLDRKQKIVYLHSVRHTLTEKEMANILGISQSYVARIRSKLMDKASKLWLRVDNSVINHKNADNFAMSLLGPETDDELSDKLCCDLAVIKICREILSIVDLYGRKEATSWA